MKGTVKYGLIGVLAVVLIGAGWGAAWVAGTTEGARWAMDAVSRHTPLSISARKIEGRLTDRLYLEGVRLTRTPVTVEIAGLDYRWQPLRLLAGLVAARELTLTGVRIQDNTPPDVPPDLAWPRVSGLAMLFDGRIERLRVNGLVYRRLDRTPIQVNAISASVSWRKALLSVSNLAVIAPDGRVTGSFAAGFNLPIFQVDLAAVPAKPWAGMDAFSLQGRFLPGFRTEQLAGKFAIAGAKGKVKFLGLAGEAGLTLSACNLRQLRLTGYGRRGSVTGGGTVTLTTPEPTLALRLAVSGLDLSPELQAPTDLSGEMTFTGTPELYRGKFKFTNRGQGWRAGHLSGAYQGDAGGARLAPVTGSLLAGSVTGNLDINWTPEVSLKGTIHGRNLDPAVLSRAWTGVINFDVSGGLAWPNQDQPRGEVSGRLLESRLHGQALTGEVQADLARGDLRIGRLALHGKGFDISAAGTLGQRLAFNAQIGQLDRLIPRTAGELRADGWVRWRAGRFAGAITGQGVNLAAGKLRIATANLAARLGEEKGYPLHVTAKLNRAAYDRFQVESLTVEADGTALRHTVRAALSTAGAEARIGLAGTYDRGKWQGVINRFSGRDSIGPWNLAAPAALTITARRLALATLVLTGAQAERLQIAAELTREPAGGDLRAEWQGLNLARANPWLSRNLQLGGSLTGGGTGKILPGNKIVLSGQLSLARGKIRWQKEDAAVAADLAQADFTWRWLGALYGSPADSGAGELAVAGRTAVSGTLTAQGRRIIVERGTLRLDGDERGLRAGLELILAGRGMVKGAFASPAPFRLAMPATGDVTAEWTGIDLALIRPWLPGEIKLNGQLAGQVTGKILPGQKIDLAGKVSLAGGQVRWQKENAAVAANLATGDLSWRWLGALPASILDISAGRLTIAAGAAVAGSWTKDNRRITVERGSLRLDGDEHGLNARVDLTLAGGGTLKGRLSSPRAAALAVPAEGEVSLEWTDIDLAILMPWLPSAGSLEGRLNGRARGNLLPEQKLVLKGDATVRDGKISWLRPEGAIQLNLRSADLAWDWQGEALSGTFALALMEQGQGRGSFQLPIPARLPIAFDRQGPLRAAFTCHVLEQGIFAALFPGFIRESQGELDADLRIEGTGSEPAVKGSLTLAKAGAYLPTAGIHVSDVRLAVQLEKDLLRIDSFQALSGPGRIEGTASVRLQGWQVASYSGSINGSRFQVVYLPELQVQGSPRLTFSGTMTKLTIRGELSLPELLISGPPTRAVVQPSRDVILEEAAPRAVKTSPLALDVQVRLVLGERVLAKVAGIDAQLGGGIELIFQNLDKITSKGEIKVLKGRYRAYGVDLEIVRGRLFYAGGPLNRPTLDILALRTVGEVRAGVTAGGILQAPQIKLYSEPSLPDVDILAYIVFGRPLGNSSSTEQAGMMAQVAGALFSKGQSAVLQEQIKNRLGLSTLELQSGGAEAAGRMGYKEIPAAPAGVSPANQAAGVSQTMLTVGKYLTPQLYFSYGRSLFTGGNLFRLRYDIFKRWQIETQTGSESGVDLFYKIEFN